MKQSVGLITLGVADFARRRRPSTRRSGGQPGSKSRRRRSFFEANGVVLVLWSRETLAADTGVADGGSRWGGITLAHNVGSRTEADQVIDLARSLGPRCTGARGDVLRRLRGGFRDLDGHAWEVAHNSVFGLGADGSVILRLP